MATPDNPTVAEFERQGYVHCPKFFSESQVADLQAEIKRVGALTKADYLNNDNMAFYSNAFRKSEYVQASSRSRRSWTS